MKEKKAAGLVQISCPRCGGHGLTDKRFWWCDTCLESGPGDGRGLVAYPAAEFLELPIAPRQPLLGVWMLERDLAMITGPRGVGKTLAALWLAYAVSTGGQFLRWQAPAPRRVVYVDGEMQADAMQDRLRHAVAAGPEEPSQLDLISADLHARPIPSLHTRDGQELIEAHLDATALLVLDNISALFGGEENDAAAWQGATEWLLKLRKRGTAVLLVHHTGKSGTQRGTSRREDILDVSVALSLPPDYQTTQGCRYLWRFTKHRHVAGSSEVESCDARLTSSSEGQLTWSHRSAPSSARELVQLALATGELSVRQIAERTGIPRSTVHRHCKAISSGESS